MDKIVGQVNSAQDLPERIVKHAQDRTLTEQDVADAKEAFQSGSQSEAVKVLAGIQGTFPNDIATDILRADNWEKSMKPSKKVRQSGQISVAFAIVMFVVVAVFLAVGWAWVTSQPGYKDALTSTASDASSNITTEKLGLVTTDHTKKHVEADEIINTCDKNGPYQTWKDKYEGHKYYYFCQLENNRGWGIVIFTIELGTKYIKTAFAPGSGTFGDTLSYLQAQGNLFKGQVK